MPVPERTVRRLVPWFVEHRREPLLVARPQSILHILLPLGGQNLRQRPQRDNDMYPRTTKVLDNPPDRVVVRRFAEELTTDDRSLFTAGTDLFAEPLPRLFVRFLVTEHRRTSHDFLGRPRCLVPLADIAKTVLTKT